MKFDRRGWERQTRQELDGTRTVIEKHRHYGERIIASAIRGKQEATLIELAPKMASALTICLELLESIYEQEPSLKRGSYTVLLVERSELQELVRKLEE